jgi:hypothetical protein
MAYVGVQASSPTASGRKERKERKKKEGGTFIKI